MAQTVKATMHTPSDAEYDRFVSKLFALGARNGVEHLHAAGAFDDSEAPLLNRLLRQHVYQALLALRHLDPNRDHDPMAAYLLELAADEIYQDDPYRAVMPGAVAVAIGEFAAEVGLGEELAADLEQAAAEGCLEHVELLARAAENEEARPLLGIAAAMLPSYWEDPDVSDDFQRLLEAARHPR